MCQPLSEKCFGLPIDKLGKSIEEAFQEEIDSHLSTALGCMEETISGADYYIGECLVNDSSSANYYNNFLDSFEGTPFLTFNYDSLLEILLFAKRKWKPTDGYGIPVKADLPEYAYSLDLPNRSSNVVLHLHGTFCIYPVEYDLVLHEGNEIQWLEERPEPLFVFDPNSIMHRFSPYLRPAPHVPGYELPYNRIIAPIPNKAEHLKKTFIKAMYERAGRILAGTKRIVTIGYSFAPSDKPSYAPLLAIAVQRKLPLSVVSPEAKRIVSALRKEYQCSCFAINMTFKQWCEAGCSLP